MSRPFFDTNVLVYAFVPTDRHYRAARELVAEGGVLSVQVLNEMTSVLRRKLRLAWTETLAALAVVRIAFPRPLPLGVLDHERALELAQRYGLSLYDALILASAIGAGCETVYTEDMQDGQVIAGTLTIRNPFTGQAT